MTNESIRNNPEAFARALGADRVVHVGKLGVTEVLNGQAVHLFNTLRRIHAELERIDGKPANAIEQTLLKVYEATQPEKARELTDRQSKAVIHAAGNLVTLNEQ